MINYLINTTADLVMKNSWFYIASLTTIQSPVNAKVSSRNQSRICHMMLDPLSGSQSSFCQRRTNVDWHSGVWECVESSLFIFRCLFLHTGMIELVVMSRVLIEKFLSKRFYTVPASCFIFPVLQTIILLPRKSTYGCQSG